MTSASTPDQFQARLDGSNSPGCRRGRSAGESGGCGDVRFQQERTSAALASTFGTMEPSPHGQRRPDAPWCSSRQETPAFRRWQLGDTFQVHVDGCLERRDGHPQRSAIDGDVEIRADRMPPLAASVGVASQGGHVGSTGRRVTSRTCQTSTFALRGTWALDVPRGSGLARRVAMGLRREVARLGRVRLLHPAGDVRSSVSPTTR